MVPFFTKTLEEALAESGKARAVLSLLVTGGGISFVQTFQALLIASGH
ncbi:MAG: hypothetical protein LBP22_04970 [Deltaproteobacteria bacterium]|nr:hypothetical protein [Deltaproteobacteria bacterium]